MLSNILYPSKPKYWDALGKCQTPSKTQTETNVRLQESNLVHSRL